MPALPATDMSANAQIIHPVVIRPSLLPGLVDRHHTEELEIGPADLDSGPSYTVTACGEGAVSTCRDNDAVNRRAGDVKHGALEVDRCECRPAGCEIVSGLQRICSNHHSPAESVGRVIMRIIGGDDAGPEPFVR